MAKASPERAAAAGLMVTGGVTFIGAWANGYLWDGMRKTFPEMENVYGPEMALYFIILLAGMYYGGKTVDTLTRTARAT